MPKDVVKGLLTNYRETNLRPKEQLLETTYNYIEQEDAGKQRCYYNRERLVIVLNLTLDNNVEEGYRKHYCA